MSPRSLRLLHSDNQAYLVEHRWPPVWYLKDYDYYQKCLAERDKELKPSLKSGSGCLCFSRKSESDPALSSSQLWPGATAHARLNSSSSPSHSLTPWKRVALFHYNSISKHTLQTINYGRMATVKKWKKFYTIVLYCTKYCRAQHSSTANILNVYILYYWHILDVSSSSILIIVVLVDVGENNCESS